jgi:hypothetical protein
VTPGPEDIIPGPEDMTALPGPEYIAPGPADRMAPGPEETAGPGPALIVTLIGSTVGVGCGLGVRSAAVFAIHVSKFQINAISHRNSALT